MWSPHVVVPVTRESERALPSIHFRAYGLGWSLHDYLGRKIVGHGGGYDGMYSRVVMVPEEHLGVVVLTNSMTGITAALANRIVDAYLGAEERDWSSELLAQDTTYRRQFWNRIAKAERERVPGTKPSLPLDRYAGTYGGDLYGNATVALEDGRLVLRLLPSRDLVADLTHLHYDTFVVDWREDFAWFDRGTALFVLNASGAVEEMRLDVPNDDLWFTELEFRRRNGVPRAAQ
jgi:hypothetical protein